MILVADLRTIAKGRLKDAENLFSAKRYDGAVYLCGYAVETALKARICLVLKWPGYPSTRREFEGYQSFRVHDLDVLLHLSGVEEKIKTHYLFAWSIVATWDPSFRYRPLGNVTTADAQTMIEARSYGRMGEMTRSTREKIAAFHQKTYMSLEATRTIVGAL